MALFLLIAVAIGVVLPWRAALDLKSVRSVILSTLVIWAAAWLFLWLTIGLPIWNEFQAIVALPIIFLLYAFTVGAITQLIVLLTAKPEGASEMRIRWISLACLIGGHILGYSFLTNVGNK